MTARVFDHLSTTPPAAGRSLASSGLVYCGRRRAAARGVAGRAAAPVRAVEAAVRGLGAIGRQRLRVQIVRAFNQIGPGMPAGLLVPDLLQRIRAVTMARCACKDATTGRTSSTGATRWMPDVLLMRIDAASGSVWNLCSGQRTRVSSLIQHILVEQNVQREIRFADPSVETLVGDPWQADARHGLGAPARRSKRPFARSADQHSAQLMSKTALITGVTGQDGSYLAELLLAKGYEVHGIVRRASLFNTERIDHLHVGGSPNPNFHLHYGDLSDAGALRNVLDAVQPDEVYNLGAQSHVRVSFDQPEYTVDVTAVGGDPPARGDPQLQQAQRQADPLLPGQQLRDVRQRQAAPARGHAVPAAQPLRLRQGLRALPGRSTTARATACSRATASSSTTRARAAARPSSRARSRAPPRASSSACRRSSSSATSTRGATGASPATTSRRCGACSSRTSPTTTSSRPASPITIRDFLDLTFGQLDLDWQHHVEIDPRYFRPAEVDHLEGDASKAAACSAGSRRPTSASLARMMVDADLRLAERERVLRDAGHEEAPRTGYR